LFANAEQKASLDGAGRRSRGSPNIDPKGPLFLLGQSGRARTCHYVALVDDHSWFLLGIRAVPTKEAVWVIGLLKEAVELCGVAHQLMTDNGTPFVAMTRSMLSR